MNTFYFASTYGSSSYDGTTYNGSTTASSTTTATTTGSTTGGGILTDTGIDLALIMTLAVVIVFAALVVRIWRRPVRQEVQNSSAVSYIRDDRDQS